MEKAIRVVSIERGRDPRDFALVAFGGAGGLHACALAEALRIPRVIVPALPGALSAFGILMSDVVKDYSRTVLWRISGKIPSKRLDGEFSALEQRAAEDFRREGWTGKVRCSRTVDIRYRGQGYELNVALTKKLLADFELEHKRRYGHIYPGREVEIVTLRLRAVVASPRLRVTKEHAGTASPVSLPRGKPGNAGREKRGWIPARETPVLLEGKKIAAKILSRDTLRSGKSYSGPAIVTEYSATTFIPPGARFHIDGAGNLIVTIQ
jgi:N-methylhydantoinase A